MRLQAAVIALATTMLAACAPAAWAGLPRTYKVQAVDSPNPTAGGDFGIGFVNTGDVNRDGKDDILVGTDEHGGGPGQIFVISGADGSTIRTISSPDPDPGGAGNTASSFGSYVGKIADIASCPGGSAGQTCPNNPSGGPDGVPDELVTALGVDVGGLVDAGRAYLIDGATGAVLKRFDMPVADIAQQLAIDTGGGKRPTPAFGRTILNPSSPYGPTDVANTGPTAPSPGVAKGDLNGGGEPDILVAASDFYETGATANPSSPCAAAGPTAQCLQAGREYMYYGESFAGPNGTNPTAIDNAPDMTIKNPTAQPDDPISPVNANRENLGYSIEPVGDVGKCNSGGGPGVACANANSTGTPDGKPDFALSSHRSDDFGMFDVGVVHLIDGATGSVLYTYHHPEPQPASLFGFSNYNQPAVGDLGQSSAVDVYQAAMRQDNPFTGGGRAFVLNGAFKQGGSPNAVNFATLNDPTPNASEDFGTSAAGIGNVVGAEGGLDGRNEVLVGAYGPHNPGTNPYVVNDVHIFSALNEQELQRLTSPDQQAGLGFGTALAPMGDLNGDDFQDYAIGAGLWDGPAGANQGRIYIFRSDNSPAPGGGGGGGTGATALAGRTVDLVAAKDKVQRGQQVSLRGVVEAFANPAACAVGQPVQLQRRTAGQLTYTTFATTTSDASGAFSAVDKPSRTSDYRALVGQTAACLGAASDRTPVTVAPSVRLLTRTARLTRTRLVIVSVDCRTDDAPCTGTVKLRTRDRLHGRRVTLGTSAFQSPGTQRRPVRVLVTAPVAAELRAAGSVRVYAFITGRDARGAATTIRAQLRVRGR